MSIKQLGFDGVNIVRKSEYLELFRYSNKIVKYWNKFQRFIGKAPYHYDYNKIYHTFIKKEGLESNNGFYPTLLPNWDHSPRSGKRGDIFYNSTPQNFEKHLKETLKVITNKKCKDNLVFLKSWNEWGEGNYVEPDKKYGKGYLDVLRKHLDSNK